MLFSLNSLGPKQDFIINNQENPETMIIWTYLVGPKVKTLILLFEDRSKIFVPHRYPTIYEVEYSTPLSLNSLNKSW